jgi:hypothetical protein
MSLRARIFIIISVAVLLILSVSIFLVVKSKNNSNVDIPANTSDTSNTGQKNPSNPVRSEATQVPAGSPVKLLTSLEVEQKGVEQLAKVFIERYGTYSTDNEFANIKEVQPLVTKSLWATISLGIGAKNTTPGFLGLTTKAVSATSVSWSDTKAVFDLKIMRNENKNGAVANRYQNVTVEMVKENNVWLVNSLVWK